MRVNAAEMIVWKIMQMGVLKRLHFHYGDP